jgi:hypothetical protein
MLDDISIAQARAAILAAGLTPADSEMTPLGARLQARDRGRDWIIEVVDLDETWIVLAICGDEVSKCSIAREAGLVDVIMDAIRIVQGRLS